MSEPQVILELNDVSVEFRARRRGEVVRAVNNVSFDVRRGEAVGLVGESGSGKSSIARAILGLAPGTTGSILFDGKPIGGLTFRKRRALAHELQVIWQDPTSSLNPSLSIARSLAEPMLAQGVTDRSTIRRKVSDMLQKVGLSPDAANRFPSQFSGGQRQRICIARSLMLQPKLVICDEVLSALDLSVQAQILNLLEDLRAEHELSYLFISHDLEVVRHLCERTVVLYQGRVMEQGATRTITERPRHPYTQALQAASPVPDPEEQRLRRQRRRAALREYEIASAPNESKATSGCPYVARCALAVERCSYMLPEPRGQDDGVTVACHVVAGDVLAVEGQRRAT